MKTTIAYGRDAALALDLADGVELTHCRAPRGEPLPDPAAATTAALRQPLGFPPLAQAVVPGDRVVLALDCCVPRAADVIGAVVRELVGRGVLAEDIVVLRTADDAAAGAPDPRGGLPPEVAAQVALEEHRADDPAGLAYLATDARGQQIYLNRRLADADLVVAIGCLRLKPSAGYYGLAGGIYPAFADAPLQARFRALPLDDLADDGARDNRAQREAQRATDEVSWLLGARFCVAVVPGPADDALVVLAGDREAVGEQGERWCREAWRFHVHAPAELVVAALGGGADRQTWAAAARAAAAAHRVVAPQGSIVLCSQIATPPGKAVRKVLQAEERAATLRRMRKHPPADLVPATELCWALDAARVYLLSRLPGAAIEDLGLTPLEDAGETARLARRHPRVTILENAQHIQAVVG